MPWWRMVLLKTALGASCVLFFGVAIGLLVQGSRLRRGGWLDVFEDDYPWFHAAYVLSVVFLSILVASLAISGFYGVLFRHPKQWVVMVYAGTMLLTFAFCLFLSIEGAISLGTAQSWKSRSSIDTTIEGNVEANFNQVYCVSQAAFLCSASSSAQWLVHFGRDDLRDLYLAKQIASTVKQAMAAKRASTASSLLDLCEDESSPLHFPELSDDIADLCTWCGNIANLKSYVHLVSWANSKCAPNKPSAQFCIQNVWINYTNPANIAPPVESPQDIFATGQIATQGASSSPLQYAQYEGRGGYQQGEKISLNEESNPSSVEFFASDAPQTSQPYEVCRKTFLSYWSYLSAWFLGVSLLLLGFMVVVIRVSWVVLRPHKRNSGQGSTSETTPLKSSQPTSNGTTSTGKRPPGSTRPADYKLTMARSKAMRHSKNKASA